MQELEKLKKEQEKLSKKVLIKDDFDEIRLIAGSDIVCTGNKLISIMTVYDYTTLERKEVKYTLTDSKMRHYKEFAGFRDMPSAVETYHKLELDPDIIIVKGTGIMHPRRFGEATQLGLMIDKPTIGVSKEFIYGDLKEDYIYDENSKKIGHMMITKDHAKPIYISPGHRISLKSSIELIKKFLGEKKLPIPIHDAHKYGNKIKKKLKEENN